MPLLALFKDLHENDGVSFLIVTHSKEVAAFANRSLELRDGRFVAEHGEGVDVEDLSEGRELMQIAFLKWRNTRKQQIFIWK